MSLAEKALLVQLRISQWSGVRRDKKITEEVAAGHGVSKRSGSYSKVLLPGNVSLAEVHARTAAVRKYYHTNTSAWGIEGTQILAATHIMEFSTRFSELRREWDNAVSAFVADYPRLVAGAPSKLKSMFDPADYPDPSTIHLLFNLDVTMFPVPETDFRVAISEAQKDELREQIERRVTEAYEATNKDLAERLLAQVETMAVKLKDHTSILTSSLFSNTQEMCRLLKKMNISSNMAFDRAIDEVGKLADVNPDVVRLDPTVRDERANEASRLLEIVKGFV